LPSHFQSDFGRLEAKQLKDISTLYFSSPSFNPGPFNPRLFNHEPFKHELFNPTVQKYMVEKSGVEKFTVQKSGIEMSFNVVNSICLMASKLESPCTLQISNN
jgi:hypothetical protein